MQKNNLIYSIILSSLVYSTLVAEPITIQIHDKKFELSREAVQLSPTLSALVSHNHGEPITLSLASATPKNFEIITPILELLGKKHNDQAYQQLKALTPTALINTLDLINYLAVDGLFDNALTSFAYQSSTPDFIKILANDITQQDTIFNALATLPTESNHALAVKMLQANPNIKKFACIPPKVVEPFKRFLRQTIFQKFYIRSVALEPKETLIAIGTHQHGVIIIDTVTGKQISKFPQKSPVRAISFNNRGLVVAGLETGNIVLIDTKRSKITGTLLQHTQAIRSLTFNTDGTVLAAGSEDGSVSIWDIDNKKLITTITDHSDAVTTVQFSKDSTYLITASTDGTINLHNARDYTILRKITLDSAVVSAALSPHSQFLVAGCQDASAAVITIPENLLTLPKDQVLTTTKMQGFPAPMVAVAFGKEGNLVAIASSSTTTFLDLTGPSVLQNFVEPGQAVVQALAYSNSGILLITGSSAVNLWYPYNPALKSCQAFEANITAEQALLIALIYDAWQANNRLTLTPKLKEIFNSLDRVAYKNLEFFIDKPAAHVFKK